MIVYRYAARNEKTGEIIKADISAHDEQGAAKLLIERGLFPISVEEQNKGSFNVEFGSGVSSKDRVVFTRQLATLINAGLPLTQSLRTVREQVNSKKLLTILDEVTADVEGGTNMHDAFAKHPKVFNPIYLSLIEAGEASGTLDKTLERIAFQQEKDAAIVSKLRGALIYPAVVLTVILIVLVCMLVLVVPQIASLFKDLNKALPLQTRFLIGFTDFIIHYWWVVLFAIVGLVLLGISYKNSVAGRRLVDEQKIHWPVFGALLHKMYMARFCRTVGTLVGTGVPLLKALEIVKNAISNVYIAEGIQRAIGEVQAGKSLSGSLEKDERFMVLVPQMIKIGETSGSLDDMMARAAQYYEAEVDETVNNLSVLIEPVLMVGLGVLVLVLVLTILLPIYGLVGSGVQ